MIMVAYLVVTPSSDVVAVLVLAPRLLEVTRGASLKSLAPQMSNELLAIIVGDTEVTQCGGSRA